MRTLEIIVCKNLEFFKVFVPYHNWPSHDQAHKGKKKKKDLTQWDMVRQLETHHCYMKMLSTWRTFSIKRLGIKNIEMKFFCHDFGNSIESCHKAWCEG